MKRRSFLGTICAVLGIGGAAVAQIEAKERAVEAEMLEMGINEPFLAERCVPITVMEGDVITLTVKGFLTRQAQESLGRQLKRLFPGHQIAIIEDGARLDVWRAGQEGE